MKLSIIAALVVAVLHSTSPSNAQEDIRSLGSGSYSVKLPQGCEPLPARIYKSPRLKGATPTNQWWSSLVWEPHSQNMFPHPLGMVCCNEGLSISYPGAAIVAASGNIMGGGVSANGDIVIGHSGINSSPAAKLSRFSSWFVTAEFAQDGAALRTTFGHGSPFVYARINGGLPRIRLADKPQVWSDTGSVLGITVRGNHYGLFGALDSEWKPSSPNEFTNETTKDYFSVALLPDKQPTTLALFARYAHSHVVDTQVSFEVEKGQLKTSYRITTDAVEKSNDGTIFALYPHHWKYSETPTTDLQYRSVRGTMKVATGTGFQTTVPVQGVLPMLPEAGIPDRSRMIAYLQTEASRKSPAIADTYWEGKHLGKLATLSGIAETVGAKELQTAFVTEIRWRLENWFVASQGENQPLFFFDENWGTLIGSKPSYGSDSQLNDHHFHYGYFIRAAAEVARLDPAWAKEWGPIVELLIRDISAKHADSMFPAMRCFDVFAGHSWASGHAKFGDGNNQESSSESLNAWYALMLWGEATGNQEIRNTGVFLFNTERTAVEEYWFDVSGTNFPADYPHEAVGMVWGGKGAFATWFSGDIDRIHGINWLPFTPASIYMGRFPDYIQKTHDRMIEQRKAGQDYNEGWGDLLAMFSALSDPASAVTHIDANPNCNVEEGNTHAFMCHWIHTLDKLGRIDATVTADHPFFNVYVKDGNRTYVAFNFGDEPLTVRFSDGTSMSAAPRKTTLRQQ